MFVNILGSNTTASLTSLSTTTMLVTAVLLGPAIATPLPQSPAVQDFAELRLAINEAAATIGERTNSSRNWGNLLPGVGDDSGEMGTADLVQNISTTILHLNYNLQANKTSWLSDADTTLGAHPPTAPLTEPIPIPTTPLPPSASKPIDLNAPYIDYVSSIPSLSTALTALGRAWHNEMNEPVRTSIASLQEAIQTFSTNMLSEGLIQSTAVLRTIRASSTLEDAEQAWSRFLNLPGNKQGPAEEATPGPEREKRKTGRSLYKLPGLNQRMRFTHQDLWGRENQKKANGERAGRRFEA